MFKVSGLTFKNLKKHWKSQTFNFECMNSSNIRPIGKITKLMTGIAEIETNWHRIELTHSVETAALNDDDVDEFLPFW